MNEMHLVLPKLIYLLAGKAGVQEGRKTCKYPPKITDIFVEAATVFTSLHRLFF